MPGIGETRRQRVKAAFSVLREILLEALASAEHAILPLIEDSHEKGTRWEREFSGMAADRGLAVEDGAGREDLVVAGVRVQCKHIDALRSGDTLDIANMRPVGANNGHRGYMIGEYDVLALRHGDGVYLIPATWLDAGNGTLASRIRLSLIGQFRDAWEVFDTGYAAPRRDAQQSLWMDG